MVAPPVVFFNNASAIKFIVPVMILYQAIISGMIYHNKDYNMYVSSSSSSCEITN
jgi:hypothetical protein